jgi:hypothetical protein
MSSVKNKKRAKPSSPLTYKNSLSAEVQIGLLKSITTSQRLFNFSSVAEGKEDIFGAPGSSNRKKVLDRRTYLANLLKHHPADFVSHLDQHKLEVPTWLTKRLAEKETAKQAGVKFAESAEPSSSSSSSEPDFTPSSSSSSSLKEEPEKEAVKEPKERRASAKSEDQRETMSSPSKSPASSALALQYGEIMYTLCQTNS